ncbi:GGDEF domain-containing protein [Photobacterium sp. 1_MG-2023]|uniref:GGDEF domain-containing protein n=1 Tax=Photobacterium sp. 1_MG-2023 TaxID=3062646 RepID=UPI0026E3D2ED|nr:GGDEF domain-containing protein [Photobacterium sp. 1_MG-2023]MDO6707397.1 GGDEF domain-containing protein [Photobacterium sp. 1_MG-2023]
MISTFNRFHRQLCQSLKLYVPDLWSAKAHSQSFQNTRSGYLRSRISLLCIVWAVLIIAWIPFDFFYLDDNEEIRIAIARLILATFLILIARFNESHTTLRQSQWCLVLLVTGLNLFYSYCIWVLGFPKVYSGFEYGYTLLPILHVAILTILPITLKESLCLLALTAVTEIIVDAQAGTLHTPETLANYWLQNVLAIMVIWSQLSKLYMLMRLYRQATLDPLTGIYNRRMLMQQAQKALDVCQAKRQPFSLLLFDIDRFKRINDSWGHGIGDKVLRGFADHLQQSSRKTDLFGRYGGEEFILCLPYCDTFSAQKIADRMLQEIRDLAISTDIEDTQIAITACIGIATFTPGDSLMAMIDRADRALYECKDAGRDCFRFHPHGYRPSERDRRKSHKARTKSAPRIVVVE